MNDLTTSFENEVKQGERFGFGENWKNFLLHLTEERIKEAEKSLLFFLEDVNNKTFIDVGSGSGLFSLAAKRSGGKVLSFDYDPSSVFCTMQLKQKYYPVDSSWNVEKGSVLDDDYIKQLGQFDIVYSWGVLHHTGNMWQALKNAAVLVKPGGKLFIAIYNNQGALSKYWTAVKKLYNKNAAAKILVSATHIPVFFLRTVAAGIIRHGNPLGYFENYKKQRGMNVWHDWIDWLGGYPFETASAKEIEDFYKEKGFVLVKEKLTRRLGCNEFVFQKSIK